MGTLDPKEKDVNDDKYLCPPRRSNEPFIEEFLPEGQGMGEFVLELYFQRRIPPSKPTSFDGSVDISGCNLLELLHCHVGGHEA